jgi:AbrB family looped-hinge helix DNA binding protein
MAIRDVGAVEGLPTTSAKIRKLASDGMARADIARLLGIRYQHVRNVLEQERTREMKQHTSEAPKPGSVNESHSVRVRLGPDGRIVIPAAFREALGLKDGQVLFAHLEEGEIALLTATAAARRARAIIRKYVPDGISLVDELIEDRRREVEREEKRG